ncbi:MAG: hypothetical protein H0W45_01640, partial [Acidobacteria bacterium]|nr:hypothetical protein [Acidobacteriota bacterium]
VLLSTDGYLNSFSDEAGFFQAGTDILNMLAAENGFDAVNENLKAWLEEATRMGSGDDCTVGIIYRPRALKKFDAAEKSEIAAESSANSQTEEVTAETPATLLPPITENPDDVTVTITFKKDKNKIAEPPIVTVNNSARDSAKSSDKNAEKESE